MIEAIAFGTIWFWLLVVVTAVLVLIASETGRRFWALFCIAGFITLMHFSGNINVPDILANPLHLLLFVGLYFVIGTPWSFLKWFSFLNQKKDELMEIKGRFIKARATMQPPATVALSEKSPIPTEEWDNFAEFVRESSYGGYHWKPEKPEDCKPHWSKYKGKLTDWILFWPWSAFWTILNDPLVRLGNWIRDRFRGVYQWQSDRVFKDAV